MIESNADELDRLVSLKASEDAVVFENQLRPKALTDYIGQESLIDNLKIAIEATKKRGESLDHILLHGPPGLGKTTLASIIAHELGANLKITSGPALEKPGDIAAIISNLDDGDVWFIDEIHRLKPTIEEVLYSAMEDFRIDMVLGKGPAARSMSINLPKFTLVGATTKMNMLSSPLRDRFGNLLKLDFYGLENIKKIISRSARILNCELDDDAAEKLAKSARGTPRIANRLLRRVRDFAEVFASGRIDMPVLLDALKRLGVDDYGLDDRDREILSVIINKFGGGPVGLSTLSAAISEEKATIEDVYEPFLIQCGFLERSNRGRLATPRAYQLLGLSAPIDSTKLF